MTKADLIEEVSRVVEMTRKDSEVIVEAIFDSIVRSLRTGDKIEIRGFGSFRTRQRQPRIGRNPKTGDAGGSARQAHPLLQAEQGTEGPGERGRRPAHRSSPGDRARRATPSLHSQAWTASGAPGDTVRQPGRPRRCLHILREGCREQDARELTSCIAGEQNFVLLNLYPYTSGHLMIAPYEHVATLEDAAEETLAR